MASTNQAGYTAKPSDPLYSTGKKPKIIHCIITNATAASDGDVCVLARGLSLKSQIIGVNFPQGHPARSGLTDVDFGFSQQSNDKVLDADALIDGISLASARTAAIDLIGSNISGFDFTKTIGELLSKNVDQEPIGGVNVIMTRNTAGSTTGTFIVDLIIAE